MTHYHDGAAASLPRIRGFYYTPEAQSENTSATASPGHPDMADPAFQAAAHRAPPASISHAVGAKLQQLQNKPLQRTPSQNSISSAAAATPHTGAQTPLPAAHHHPRAARPLNHQSDRIRCLQTLSQQRAGHAARHAADWNDDDDDDDDDDDVDVDVDAASEGADSSTAAPGNLSALALALSSQYVFSGSQRGQIYVWNRETFHLERVLYGHSAGCLSLALDDAHGVLFSGGGDGKVRAWDIHTLRCLYIVHAGVNSGAILSLAYSRTRNVLVLGCQNTSIQVFDVANRDAVSREDRASELGARRSRFFDGSSAPITVCTARPSPEVRSSSPTDSAGAGSECAEDHYVVFERSITPFAHSGYIYSLLLGSPSATATATAAAAATAAAHGEEELLLSAASDGAIKMWRLAGATIEEAGVLGGSSETEDEDEDVCVKALALNDGLLFAGLQGGGVEVWDLETMQRIRTLPGTGSSDVLSLAIHANCLYSGAADGTIRVWGPDLKLTGWISTASDSVLALVAAADDDLLVSGTDDGSVSFWDISAAAAVATASFGSAPAGPAAATAPALHDLHISAGDGDVHTRRYRDRHMLNALDQWIPIKSVSGVPDLQSECRRAARFLKGLMQQLGAADTRLISSTPSSNPLVYCRFDASAEAANALPLAHRPTIFVYGHYDVMPAGDEALWNTQPFELVGRDGYLYGRGVSDDKGPVLATLFAISELAASGSLPMTVVFCIEGEEENGSIGLHEAIEQYRDLFGVPRLILLSLSYWLGESTPCLTYGMRGSIRANLHIESTRNADVHAGVWGGAVSEPLTCLSHILARLADPSGRVLVPGFHDSVRPVSAKEEAEMRDLVRWITSKEARAPLVAQTAAAGAAAAKQAQDDLYHQLMQRWRFPTLTVHHMDVSTVAARTNTTLVPAAAQASLSVRVVPDQSLDDIAAKLRAYIEEVFGEILAQRQKSGGDGNGRAMLDDLKLHLEVKPNAQWWLADPETPVYQAAARAIREEWSDDAAGPGAARVPLLIREGGSIPAVPWLESFFAPHAVAVNLPMGQSSDNAHLDNERISLENLSRGRRIVQRLVRDISSVL
ncbi:hypothetical protein H4R18_005650 [Coemansia javaensis]|uniref:Peptidase M20 dimerisation domain-containing protein n=1 Tax=Coemansia javaensis TaxID=2761396 RepID=A0A9W8LF13_9FUNG|nr:hypothetical protein H4R18_005650 [Coemansia javaensis]